MTRVMVDAALEQTPAGATAVPAPASPKTRPTAVLAGAVGLVVVALLALLWLGMVQRANGSVGEVSVPFRQAPDFELGLFDGGTFHLSQTLAAGRPVFVNFWASWCVPCRDEAPVLEAGWQAYGDRIAFVGVDVEDLEPDARDFLRQYHVTYPNGAGNAGPISVAYGMRGVPESYFVAADGRVLRKWNGPLTTRALNRYLEELVGASGGR